MFIFVVPYLGCMTPWCNWQEGYPTWKFTKEKLEHREPAPRLQRPGGQLGSALRPPPPSGLGPELVHILPGRRLVITTPVAALLGDPLEEQRAGCFPDNWAAVYPGAWSCQRWWVGITLRSRGHLRGGHERAGRGKRDGGP